MRPHVYFDRTGAPIDVMRWCELHDDEDYVRVAHDIVVVGGHPLDVSTVWLGIDHGFGFSSVPIIFETMVFGHDDPACQRYATEADALTGHTVIVSKLIALQEEHQRGH